MSKDRYLRWQERTIEQLGYTVNLILSLAVADLGFSLSLLSSAPFPFAGVEKLFFTGSLILILASIASGVRCVVVRLENFRLTKEIARPDGEPTPQILSSLQARAEKTGRQTWSWFTFQWVFFGFAVASLSVAFLISYRHELFW